MSDIGTKRTCRDHLTMSPPWVKLPGRSKKLPGRFNCKRLSLTRRFQVLHQQPEQRVDPCGQLRILPFVGMRGMMVARGGVEHRARRNLGIGDLKMPCLAPSASELSAIGTDSDVRSWVATAGKADMVRSGRFGSF